jgi:hypothetical protein
MSRAPQYDQRIRRKGGYQWASETDLEGLQFWCDVKARANSKPEYAAKDKAELKKLSYWVSYREACPYEQWRGTRGEEQVVALAPSSKPAVHSWDTKPAAPAPERGDAWEGDDDKPNW